MLCSTNTTKGQVGEVLEYADVVPYPLFLILSNTLRNPSHIANFL